MRTHEWVIAVIVSGTVACGGGAPAAFGAATPLTGGRTVLGPAATTPDSSRITTFDAPGVLRVTVPGKADRALAVPACGPGGGLFAAATRREVFFCGGFAIDEVTGAQASLFPHGVGRLDPATTNYEGFSAQGAGSRWIIGDLTTEYAGSGKSSFTSVLVDRLTGKVTADSSTSTGTYLDLNAAHPHQRVCRPITRQFIPDSYYPSFGPLTKVGSWTLRYLAGYDDASEWVVQRCGTTKQLTLPSRSTPALGRHHVAWVTGRTVHLRTLASGVTRRLALPQGGTVSLGFSSTRLVVSQQVDFGATWEVWTVPVA
jgi:hypothetical protein